MPLELLNTAPAVYQIKVTLKRTRPPVWRRVQVDKEMSLAKLHDVLQAAMGWEDRHLHEFRFGRYRFGPPDPDDQWMGGAGFIEERKALVRQVFEKPRAKGTYTYDFGDGWEHALVLEKVLPVEPGITYPRCTGGERNCPPEDCGGVGGYEDLLDALADDTNPEHESMVTWVNGGFDPEEFDTEAANVRLKRKFSPRKKAAVKRGKRGHRAL